MTFNKTDNLRVGRTRSIHRDNPPFLVEHHKTGVSVNIVLIAKILLQELLEKPRDFDPFGQTGLSPLATI